MKKNLLLSLSLILASVAITANIANADTLDTQFDYTTDTGQWSIWARNSNDSTICDIGTPYWDATNQNYVIDVQFSPECHYMYFKLNLPHALDGTTALTANINVQVTAGQIGDAQVRLGHSVNYPGFGATGRVEYPFVYDINAGGWQTIGGDSTASLDAQRDYTARSFALSTRADLLSQTNGPVLYLFNNSYGTASPRVLILHVILDNVHVQHTGSALDSNYSQAESNAAAAYVSRTSSAFSTLDQNMTNLNNSIGALQLSNQPVLQSEIGKEAAAIVNIYDSDLAKAQSRTDASIKVLTQSQYDQDTARADTLTGLFNIGALAANSGPQIVYYPWEATGKKKLDDLSLGIPATAQQTSQTTLALNELEPISLILQNLFDQSVTVNQIAVGTLTNQFGEIFPATNIDSRVVKSWYTGSATSIAVSSSDTKVRVPELLLKDDALIKTNEVAKSNALRITSQVNQCYLCYWDISTPTAQIPNDAEAYDSTTLQPFAIPALQAKQLWFTLDTRTATKPGTYSGNIAVTYQINGDTSIHSLQIPIGFTVAPVALQDSALTYSIYYRGRIRGNFGFKADQKSSQQYVAELNDMLAHGINYPTQYLGSDLNELTNYIDLRQQAGLPCDKYFLLDGIASIGINATTAYNNTVQLINTLRQASGCSNPQLYMYGKDEAKGTDLDAEISAMQSVHNAGGKTFVAGYTGTYSHLHDLLDTIIFSGAPNDTEIGLWRADNKDVFSYGDPQVGVPDPYIYRANYGLMLWQHNYTGAMDYAYQHAFPGTSSVGDLAGCATSTTGYCSLWNDFDSSQYYDHVFAYPTTNGVVDTIQWEGFREAVDDTRYLATLQLLVKNSVDSVLVSEINNWLATIKTQANLDPIATRKTMQDYFQRLNQPPIFSNVTVTASGNTITAAGQATDPESYLGLVETKLDNGEWQSLGNNSSWQTTFSNVVDGNHTVYYRATDYWGSTTTQQRTVDAGTHGLTGEYYNNKNLANSPTLTRIDPVVNSNWGNGSPATGINSNYFSVRWTGEVFPPVSGVYTFCTTTDDGVRLSVNGTQLINKWGNQSATHWCGTISLTQNQPVPMQMDYYENAGKAVAQLLWSYPNQTETVIPTSQLYIQ